MSQEENNEFQAGVDAPEIENVEINNEAPADEAPADEAPADEADTEQTTVLKNLHLKLGFESTEDLVDALAAVHGIPMPRRRKSNPAKGLVDQMIADGKSPSEIATATEQSMQYIHNRIQAWKKKQSGVSDPTASKE